LSFNLLALPVNVRTLMLPIIASTQILLATWALWRLLSSLVALLQNDRIAHETDAVRQRSLETQVTILQRIGGFLLVLVGVGIALAQFETFRTVGASVLASAGLAGIILGFAAQRSLGNLMAGIQIALTQPIRVGDALIIEGDFGTVEDISLTFVTVRTWDLRRLVIPINQFLEKPFQNWTMKNPELFGTVLFYVDYSIDVDAFRERVKELAEASPKWNKKALNLQVTDWKERTVELRAMVSANNSGDLWDLRVYLREQMLKYLQAQEKGKAALPQDRIRLNDADRNALASLAPTAQMDGTGNGWKHEQQPPAAP